MSQLVPFRAFRYQVSRSGNPAQLTSPLLDRASNDLLAPLYQNPLHSVRLLLPQSAEQAAADWRLWKKNGVVKQDPLPAFYPYYQTFCLFGSSQVYRRKGLIAMVRIDGENNGIVRHEEIIHTAMEARIEALRQIGAQIAPTHGLFNDPAFEIERLLDEAMQRPLSDFIDEQGVRNELGVIQNKTDIEYLQRFFAQKQIFLADGHHRLATSQAVYQTNPTLHNSLHLMYLSNLAADDIRILPTHRIVDLDNGFDENAFENQLKTFFDVRPVGKRTPLYEELHSENSAIGVVVNQKQWIARLRPDIDLDRAIPFNMIPQVKRLDYTLVHALIIDKILGVPYAEQTYSNRIHYVKDYTTAVSESCPNKMVLVLKEASKKVFVEVCEAGALMPQKSTNFYPKTLGGLLFGSIDPADYQTPFDHYFLETNP